MGKITKRLNILLESEINELNSPPILSLDQKHFLFSLNDLEDRELNELRDDYSKIYFILLLGYFKTKPVVLNIRFSEIKDDFTFIAKERFPSKKFKQRNISAKHKSRLYQRIFSLLSYSKFSETENKKLQKHTLTVASVSVEPRYIRDESIHYLSRTKISITKYTTLQDIISTTVVLVKEAQYEIVKKHISTSLVDFITNLLIDESDFQLKHFRHSAKDFSPKEINKELTAMSYIRPYVQDIERVLETAQSFQHNIEYYASLVEYYTITKLNRFDHITQTLYLLCYLQCTHPSHAEQNFN